MVTIFRGCRTVFKAQSKKKRVPTHIKGADIWIHIPFFYVRPRNGTRRCMQTSNYIIFAKTDVLFAMCPYWWFYMFLSQLTELF